jgi:hypothetical protein
LSSWYLPLGQSSGSTNPYFVHLLPLGHCKQSVLSSDPVDGIYVPIGHFLHSVSPVWSC